MKLYYSIRRERDRDEHSAPTLPWQLPGKQDNGAVRVDVPSTPAELVPWLNKRRVGRVPYYAAKLADEPLGGGLALAPEPHLGPNDDGPGGLKLAPEPHASKVPGHCAACGRSEAGTLKLAAGNDVNALEDWAETIQADNLWALGRAAEIIRDRARELGAEWAERTVQ